MVASITDRQYTAARLYYCEGWTYRKIGSALSCSHTEARREVECVISFCYSVADEKCSIPPIVEAFISASGSDTGAQRDAGAALARQEALAGDIASRLERREDELQALAECIAGDCSPPSHVKRNPYDRWELELLNRTGRQSLGTGDYEARKLERYA